MVIFLGTLIQAFLSYFAVFKILEKVIKYIYMYELRSVNGVMN